MPSPADRPPLISLVGPTGVGKTALSLDLAERIGAEIISTDSRLFYRGLDIGTDKPAQAQRSRIPHHLIDFLAPDEAYSLAEFQAAVVRIAGEIHSRGRLPLMVGGTGQYVRAVVEGWQIPARPEDERLREVLTELAKGAGTQKLQAWLAALDPAAAARIDPHNTRRVVRALEVILSTGLPFSDQQRAEPQFDTLVIGLTRPRKELYERIDRRIDEMLAGGFIDEAAGLLAAGYSEELPSLSAIGYREAIRHLRGEITIEEAAASMRKRSRALVRRQANWFKAADPGIAWIEMGPQALAAAERAVRDFIKGRAGV